MAPNGRFALALALCVAIVVTATVGAVSLSSDRDAMQLDELLRVEPMPDGPDGSPEEHLAWIFEIFGGHGRWTEAALDERFTSGFNESFDATTLNAGLDQFFADFGPVRFHRVTDDGVSSIRALAVAENGTPITIWLMVSADGLVESLTLDEVPSPPRLPPWQTALLVLATWLFVGAALTASRAKDHVLAWVLLVATPLAASPVLVLGGSRVAYTMGRVLPALLVPVAVWILTRAVPHRATTLVAVGAAAGVIGMVAPLTRDAGLIAHPFILGSVADSEQVYRLLHASAFGLAGLVFITITATALFSLHRTPRAYRVHRWAVAIGAAIWSLGALGSSIDYAIDDGRWAHGSLAAVTTSAVALVPVVAVVGIAASRWRRPGIERLVINLEADGSKLEAAVATALDDPTLEILVAPDGVRLVNQQGSAVDTEHLPTSRNLTEIRSGPRLVGALAHDAALGHEPERLEAVAAAAGMALEVDRLNQRVTAQLEEVNASRARIVQASDTARRQVARDLHDGAQQRLVALGLQLQRAHRLAQSGRTDPLLDLLDDATVEVRDTIEDIRAVSRGAQPALLAERGLAAAVDALAERATVPVDIDVSAGPLPVQVESTAYFVIAEGLTNIAKHAGAAHASVSVTTANRRAVIRIEDDGAGGAAPVAGSGLEGLDDRVTATGGTFDISSTATGTILEATVPCV